jgi:hypothetical protein
MIENIVLLCPNIITLESLACTCKQIRSLVTKIFEKNISVKFYWAEGERLTESAKAEYSINGNGNTLWKLKYAKERRTKDRERIRTTKKKLQDRGKFEKLYSDILNIMNMDTSTNTTKVKEIIEKYQHDSLFSLSVDKFSFDITANDRNISYIYINSGWVWELARPDANTIHTNYDGEISWDTLDEKIVQRFKCAWCTIKVHNFLHKIYSEFVGTKSISIKIRNIEPATEKLELTFSDSGEFKARYIHWSDRQDNKPDNENETALHLRPSVMKEIFGEIARYNMLLQSQEESASQPDLDLDSEDRTEFRSKKLERNVNITVDDIDYNYEQMKAYQFEGLMKILTRYGCDLDEEVSRELLK